MLQPSSPKHHNSSKQCFQRRREGEADAGGREQDFGAHSFRRTNGENKSSLRMLVSFTPRSPSFSNFSTTQEMAIFQLPTLAWTSQIRLPALLLASVWLLSPRPCHTAKIAGGGTAVRVSGFFLGSQPSPSSIPQEFSQHQDLIFDPFPSFALMRPPLRATKPPQKKEQGHHGDICGEDQTGPSPLQETPYHL